MDYKLYQVDVFTGQALCGNPLAVFPESSGLETETMQKIAREMNLSETTFVFPSADGEADFDVRIFTPGKEIPFGGHPTLGTAFVLRHCGLASMDQEILRLRMPVGVIPVRVDDGGRQLSFTQPTPEFSGHYQDFDKLAQALSIDSDSIDKRWPVEVVSTGFPALFVPLASLPTIQSIQLNLGKLRQILDEMKVDMLYAFTLQTLDENATLHSRAFAPFIGITEDPATGSAAGAIGGYLAKNKVIHEDKFGEIKIEQGFEIDRPSQIYVQVSYREGEIQSIQVGGETCLILEGVLKI
ncbi:MAG: PhzF family phenazine biosynthesis protein [Nitrospinales bacterium]